MRDVSQQRITVVVADDHPVYRQGIIRGLTASGRIEVVADVASGREALDAIQAHKPDVALLDFKMNDLDGLDVAHAVARDGLPTKVVMLSAFDDSSIVYKALAEGVSGYLTKEADRDEIVHAILTCARGKTYLPAHLVGGLAGEVKQRAQTDSGKLTARELEVVKLIADGMSVPDMAAKLHLSPSTIKTHVQNLYDKLGVSDRGAAVAEAMRRLLLE
jgi:two-component system, NarL family, nitrate/nitrite response regulator NarL